MPMTKGQVKWFDPKKGYGFIYGPEGQDVFVHYSHIQSEGFRTLKDGEWVEYELIQGEKGWQARTVKAIAGEAGGIPPQSQGQPMQHSHAPSHAPSRGPSSPSVFGGGPPQSTPARPAAPPVSSGYEAGPSED